MAKALIFGSNGFVGPWLARELASHGWEVACSDRADGPKEGLPAEYYRADLLDAGRIKEVVSDARPDAVVNLAAVSSVGQSWRAPAATIEVNVVGSIDVLEAAKALGTCPKVLLVGSSEEYEPSEGPLSEESPLSGNNPYGISKRAVGELADLYEAAGDVRVYRTRSFNHTGPGQVPSFVVPSWCRQVADIERSGKPGSMRVGNLSVRRDISDVRDIVRGYRMLLESDWSGEVFNLGSGTATPLKDILETVIGFSSQEIEYEVDPALIRLTDQPCVQADVSKAARELGWRPEIPLLRTLRDVYEGFLGAGA
jgi:GDP-4-dehydro-6-deoxy-D-mannose reductase